MSTQELKRRKSKKSALETVYKEEVIEMFTKWFKKQGSLEGTVMTKTNVLKDIIKNLDKKQDDALEKAMRELEQKGFIRILEDGFSLELTAKGVENL